MDFLVKSDNTLYVFNLKSISRASAFDYVKIKKNQNVNLTWECESWKKDVLSKYYLQQSAFGKSIYDGMEIVLVRYKEHKYWLFQGEITSTNPWT